MVGRRNATSASVQIFRDSTDSASSSSTATSTVERHMDVTRMEKRVRKKAKANIESSEMLPNIPEENLGASVPGDDGDYHMYDEIDVVIPPPAKKRRTRVRTDYDSHEKVPNIELALID